LSDLLQSEQKPHAERLHFSPTEAEGLYIACIQLLSICARASYRVEPSAGLAMAYVQDEVMIELFGDRF